MVLWFPTVFGIESHLCSIYPGKYVRPIPSLLDVSVLVPLMDFNVLMLFTQRTWLNIPVPTFLSSSAFSVLICLIARKLRCPTLLRFTSHQETSR